MSPVLGLVLSLPWEDVLLCNLVVASALGGLVVVALASILVAKVVVSYLKSKLGNYFENLSF